MDNWQDILSTRKWPNGIDMSKHMLQRTQSVPNWDSKTRLTDSREKRNATKNVQIRYGNGGLEYEDIREKYWRGKRHGGINSARLERFPQLDTSVASSSTSSSRGYQKEYDRKKGKANLTSTRIFMPLVKFRKAARIVLLLLKATASSRHASQDNQNQKSWSQITEEQNTARRTNDLSGISFDPSVFKPNREKYLSNEAKIIMSLYPADRTEDQLKLALLGLKQTVDAFGEFPIKLQRSLASVGWYENFDAKRVIIRQGHMADNFYFILSGTAVVTLLEINKDTGEQTVRTVAFLHTGNSFGELALMHGAKRNATVTCQTNVELLAVSREDFIDIFMHIEKDKEPEHISFLRTIDVFRGWPVERLPHDNPRSCLFTFFRRGVLLCKDSNSTDWIYVIKTGSCRVLKDLFDTRPNITGLEYVPYSLNQSFTKLPPINRNKSTDSASRSNRHASIQHNANRHVRLPDIYKRSSEQLLAAAIEHQAQLNAIFERRHKVPRRDRYSEDSSHLQNRSYPSHAGKVFVQIQKLTSRGVFGLEQTVFGMIGQTTSCSLVSDGAECILINKKFFLQHLSDTVAKQIRKTIRPIPSEERLQQKLQDKANWDAYKSMTVSNCVVFKKQLHEHEHRTRNTKLSDINSKLGDSLLKSLLSAMMKTSVESDGVVDSLENISSDSADVERNSEVKVLDNTENVHADILENPAPDRNVHLCDPCVIDESENRAYALCVVCVEYMCEQCCREHKKYKATRNHKVLKDNIPEEPTTFKYIRKMMNCSVHDETELTHKCEDHNTYVCVLRTAGVHRKCETVTELSESFTLSENKASDLRLKIEELKEKNHRVSITQNANIHDLTIEKKGIVETVSDIVNRCTSDLLEMKSKIVHEADRLTEEHLKAMKGDAAKCTTLEDEYNLFREVLETVEQYGSKIEINMILAIIQEKLDLAQQEVEKQQKREEMHLLYTRNKHMPLFQNLGTLELKRIMSRNVGENKCEEETQPIISKENNFKDLPKLEETDCESKTNEAFCIKVGDDFFECSVSGCAVLDDGTIVIIDEENRKIKVFDTSYKLICAVWYPAPPSDVCITDKYKFAVVYKVLKKIEFLELKNGKLLTVREIPTKYENSRISANRTSKQLALVYHIDYRLRGCIQIREFSGKVLQDISLDSILSVSDRAEFGICYLEDGLVVVSRISGVKCLIPSKYAGCITAWQFDLDDNIEVTRYISADKDGTIYICTPANSSIYRISRKCPKPLVSRIQNPLSVAIDHERKRMIVGCFMTNCAHVVYSPFIN